MQLSLLQYALWLVSIGLKGGLVCLLIRRRLTRLSPLFFVYIAFQFFRSVLQFAVWHIWPRAYDKVHWSGEAVGFALAYLLILGFWKEGLRSYRGIWLVSRWLLAFACVGLFWVVRATTQFGQGAPPQATEWFNFWMILMDRTVLFTQAVLLFIFFLVLGLFRLRISTLVRGLALCWFGYSIIGVTLYSLEYFFGPSLQAAYSSLLSMSSVLLLGAWAVVVWKFSGEQEVEVAPVFALRTSPQQVMERMELLNDSLLRMWKGSRA